MRYCFNVTMVLVLLFVASERSSTLTAGVVASISGSAMKISIIDLNAASNRRMTANDVESTGTRIEFSVTSPVFQDFPSEDYTESTQVRQIDARVVVLYDKNIYEFDSTGDVVFVNGNKFLSGKHLKTWFKEYIIPLNLSLNYRPAGARELRLHQIKKIKSNQAGTTNLKKNS